MTLLCCTKSPTFFQGLRDVAAFLTSYPRWIFLQAKETCLSLARITLEFAQLVVLHCTWSTYYVPSVARAQSSRRAKPKMAAVKFTKKTTGNLLAFLDIQILLWAPIQSKGYSQNCRVWKLTEQIPSKLCSDTKRREIKPLTLQASRSPPARNRLVSLHIRNSKFCLANCRKIFDLFV